MEEVNVPEFEPRVEHIYSLEIQSLDHDVIEMASRAEAMIGNAVDALVRADAELAEAVMLADDEVDQLDEDIEMRCLRMLSLGSPIGSDLRLVGATIKMITDIERVADLAVDIAACAKELEKEMVDGHLVDVRQISMLARKMFREAIEAYVQLDLSRVESVRSTEEMVDALNREFRRQLHDSMRTSPDTVVAASWTLTAVANVERIADHALNIAERVEMLIENELGRTL